MTKFVKIREESALLHVPKVEPHHPFHESVFYNHRMRFNRSFSSLAVAASGVENACDAFCATGVRGIRYSKENKLKEVTFVDANPDAVKILNKNIKLNKIRSSTVLEENANVAFNRQMFEWVEVDPFGCPTQFLENALRAVKNNGYLSVTGTDLAATSGARPSVCKRHYDAKALKNEYCHETALRILIARIARTAALLEKSITPVASMWFEHSVKVVVRVEEGATKADETLKHLGFLNYCSVCLTTRETKLPESSECCGKKTEWAGPLWLGDCSDEGFLKKMLSANHEREYSDKKALEKTIALLVEELGSPAFYYDLHEWSSVLKKPAAKTEDVVTALRAQGFKASKTHYSGSGVKTNASSKEFKRVLETNKY